MEKDKSIIPADLPDKGLKLHLFSEAVREREFDSPGEG